MAREEDSRARRRTVGLRRGTGHRPRRRPDSRQPEEVPVVPPGLRTEDVPGNQEPGRRPSAGPESTADEETYRTGRATAAERQGSAVMSNLRAFKQKLAAVARLREEKRYDDALAAVEEMRKTWPGNGHLLVLWADLVQLQENPRHSLDEAKQALQHAMELDDSSPASGIELGAFLDNVEDNPRAAAKVYAGAVAAARQLLLDGLIGQAKALLQLDK